MKNDFPTDLVPQSFMDRFGSHIKCVLGGWDRMRFHGSLRPLFSPEWMRTYLVAAKVQLTKFAEHARDLSQQIIGEAVRIAQQTSRPYQYLRSNRLSKEELIEQIAQRDGISSGLIAVLAAMEPCLTMTVRGCRDRQWLTPVREERKCLHLYYYYEHPEVGRCHLRLQTWYPFSVDVCLNGRLWLARQMDAAGLAYRRADNCFVELADPLRVQQLADSQHQTDWLKLLGQMLDQAHPLKAKILQPFPQLSYYWTVTQSEFATDVIFKDPQQLARAYRAFVFHGITTFQSPQVMRFLGHRVPLKTGRVHGKFQGQVRSDLADRHEGVCLKHRAGYNGIKIYDKMAQVLRVENTIIRPEAFTIYRPASPASKSPTLAPGSPTPPAKPPRRSPPSLRSRITSSVLEQKPQKAWKPLLRTVTEIPRRAQVSRAANHRYLDALASTHMGTPLGEQLARLCRPVTQNGRRYRGLHPFGTDAQLLLAISRGEWTISGVRNRDLQRQLYPNEAPDRKKARSRSAAVGRKIRLLRAHGLLRKLPHTHRYQITEWGRQILTALAAAQQASTEKLTKAIAA